MISEAHQSFLQGAPILSGRLSSEVFMAFPFVPDGLRPAASLTADQVLRISASPCDDGTRSSPAGLFVKPKIDLLKVVDLDQADTDAAIFAGQDGSE